MSKTFKVVCVSDASREEYLSVGSMYEARRSNDTALYIAKTDNEYEDIHYNKQRFLRLPTEPKTCADMTMGEYLAMRCLLECDCSQIEQRIYGSFKWRVKVGKYMDNKCGALDIYRVKPEKSAKDIEIERIEKEMRKLADDLAKIKEK